MQRLFAIKGVVLQLKIGDHRFQQLKTSHDSCWGSNHTSVEEVAYSCWRIRITQLKSSHYICWKFRITTIEEVALRWWIRIIQQLKRSYFSCWMFRITTVGNIRLQQSVMTRCTLHNEIQIKLLDAWNYKDQQVCKFTRLTRFSLFWFSFHPCSLNKS